MTYKREIVLIHIRHFVFLSKQTNKQTHNPTNKHTNKQTNKQKQNAEIEDATWMDILSTFEHSTLDETIRYASKWFI